jgi:hypothetical protein
MYVNKQNEWHTALVSGFEFEKPSKNNEEIQKAICLLKKAGFTVED